MHRRCGVYTKSEVVCRILDAIDWRGDIDLSQSCLLEPAAGDGAFVAEAAKRLVASLIVHGIELRACHLVPRIVAYELHPREAELARQRVIEVLREAGLHHRTARACARAWIITGDFLLADLPLERFTHAAGNPPYVRWSKIPPKLKERYEAMIPSAVTVGDLFLPFLDRTLEALRAGGRFGFLCSDRWRFMGFAEGFRQKWLPALNIQSETTLSAAQAFVGDVDSYPTILIAVKRRKKKAKPRLEKRHRNKTLTELGCVVKVGPALGHTAAFVLDADEHDVEPELLRPWIDGSDIKEGSITRSGRRVVAMYGKDGKLIDPKKFPLLLARLKRFRKELKKRSIVRDGAQWFRTIDRVIAGDWKRPKLLVPELAKTPRVCIDRSGGIPSHGVYVIFAPDDNVEALYERLRDGRLAKALNGIAPKVKGGYVRCYKRFLLAIRLAA
ncbi:MAG: Eco57I restriction-modification methylase domain-containing protein [Acidobacteriota bacterium]